MIVLDGSTGEGGGQILRSALALSMITGLPFRIENIRANRPKPGLMRQHLVAVQAAAEVCGAVLDRSEVGTRVLDFMPGKIRGGRYEFAIGSAGSCTLVLQTILPALLFADAPSQIRISGGTHNAKAPPVQFLQRAFLPILAKMGAKVDLQLLRYGFYPAGGGIVAATIEPCAYLQPIDLMERGPQKRAYAESLVANVPFSVAKRELNAAATAFGFEPLQLQGRELQDAQGPGNALMLTFEHEHVSELFCAFGEKGVPAEMVAKAAIDEAWRYLESKAALGEHLADQVMLPMALAGGGSFTAESVSLHARTNAEVIEKFLPVRFSFEQRGNLNEVKIQRV
jgi:RNA 3'-terminal phosphate cyclase (ATP)